VERANTRAVFTKTYLILPCGAQSEKSPRGDIDTPIPAITECVTPRFFSGQEQFPFLQVDDFSYVEYRHRANQYRNQIRVTAYLFVVILSGAKIIHTADADPSSNFVSFLHTQYSTRKRDLQSLMERYFLTRVTIAELAMLSGRSLSAFKREFKEVFHEPPQRWITNRRLEHARVLLAGSDLNVSEICIQVGFDNFSHFSQIFKKKYGFPPSTLQKIRN